MRIFQRYIAAHFWGPFLFGTSVFALLVFLADTFEHINVFMKSGASAGVVIHYLLLGIPYWTLKIIPIATLLGVLFAIGRLIDTGEWKAGLAGGYHPYQMVMPFILCSVVIAFSTFILQETIVPSMHSKALRIYNSSIKKNSNWKKTEQTDVTIPAGRDRFISAQTFSAKTGTMKRVVMDCYTAGTVSLQIDALEAGWDSSLKRWVFKNGVSREFPAGKKPKETAFKSRVSDISTPPSAMITDVSSMEELTLLEIIRRTKRLKRLGTSTYMERTALQSKLSFPFSNIIMGLIGIPFALGFRKANRMLYFGIALGTAFVFWWTISIGQTAGESGMIPPIPAAWSPVFIFALIGLYGLKKEGIILQAKTAPTEKTSAHCQVPRKE